MSDHAMISSHDDSISGSIERRAVVRYFWNQGAVCEHPLALGGDGPGWPAQVRDISIHGLSLITKRWLRRDTLLQVELESASENFFSYRLVRVSHSTRQADGSWLLGCVFICQLAGEELHALLS